MNNFVYEPPWPSEPVESCIFYHTMDLPTGPVIGDWDLRPVIRAYLGLCEFKGKRVLDIGAASGFLSFYCERQGAEVVSFDMSEQHPMDLAPGWADDMASIRRVKKSYWHAHAALGSKASVFYGNVYNLPVELGHFDVAILGSILLHLENPYGALRSAAKLADTLIVTDAYRPYHPETGMIFRPAYPDDFAYWWYIPAESATRMLVSLGYKVAPPVMLRATGRKCGHIDLYALVATRN